MNKSGRIYDVPEQLAEQCVTTKLSTSKEAIGDMLGQLRRSASASSEAALDECGCCCIYANYCPNR